MSQRRGRYAAHCPGWPLQPNGASHPAARDAPSARAVDPGDLSASPAGLTARAKPEAKPKKRAANLRRRLLGGRDPWL